MKLYYIYDALCGWCYGFSPTMTQFHAKHGSSYQLEVISGGMIRGNRVGPLRDMADYIRGAYPRVEETTGVTFGEGFLAQLNGAGEAVYSSVPPSVALSLFKKAQPEQQLAFAHRLQSAIYSDGIDPSSNQALAALAAEFGEDAANVQAQLEAPESLQLAEEDFFTSQQFGVNGFPTVVLEANNKLMALSRGFLPLEHLEANFERAQALAAQAEA